MCNLGSIQGQAACCLFGAGFLHKEGRQVTVCSLNLQISPASKNRAPIGDSLSFIFSHRHGYCDVFLVGKCLKVSGSEQSEQSTDVRSENSITTCCAVNANILRPAYAHPYLFENASFFLRFQKNSRPLVEFSHSLRLFTCIP